MGRRRGLAWRPSSRMRSCTGLPRRLPRRADGGIILSTTVEIRGLRKMYSGTTVVDIPDLKVEAGEFVCLLGPSGCGKTTTLKMIAGLVNPDSGDILFSGESIIDTPPEKRNVGMVFQNYLLFPHMDVFSNIAFGLRMANVPKTQIKARVENVVQLVKLEGLESRFPHELSGGQQQRVAIARAVVMEPRLLLMDEPLANLDAKLRLEMRSFILELQRNLAITTIFVTHDQSEAITLSDRIAVMFRGVISQYDDPRSVFETPATRDVADFIGAENIFKITGADDAGRTSRVRCLLGEVAISPSRMPDGEGVFYAVCRPEHVRLLDGPSADDCNCFEGTVTEAIYQGQSMHYIVTVNGQPIRILSAQQTPRKSGTRVWVQFPVDHIWVVPGR